MFRKIIERFEYAGRAKTLTVLRGFSEDRLIAGGISPVLLAQGIDAWPWRVDNDGSTHIHTAQPVLENVPAATIENNFSGDTRKSQECEFDTAA